MVDSGWIFSVLAWYFWCTSRLNPASMFHLRELISKYDFKAYLHVKCNNLLYKLNQIII
jgi:hypothetical protein